MHRNLQLLSVFKRAFFDDQITLLPIVAHGVQTLRGYSGKSFGSDIKPFREVLQGRREEAQRSLLVQVQSDHSCEDLYDYCCEFGNVRSMHHYHTPKNVHYVLVEMETHLMAEDIIRQASHLSASQAVPVLSPFLWFKVSIKKRHNKIFKTLPVNFCRGAVVTPENKDTLLKNLNKALSVSDQLSLLLKMTTINDLGTRLRFLTARQIELALSGLFRDIHACPFGSSVNGFGRNGCDLDLVLVFPETATTESRLVFHAKACSPDDRLQIQNHIELIGDLMNCFMPGCTSVKKITQARVPIIKYRQELTHLDCDISLYNPTCLQMSEVLYLMGSIDPRVKELVVAVRAWAKEVGLTNATPGRWVSNFSLTLLVLFFLQQSSIKILPPLTRLRQHSFIMTSDEFRNYAAGLTSQITYNTTSTEEILLKFFQFYATFDFNAHGINLLSGKTVVKPDYSAMFIVNPVEPELNVSKNVSPEESERLRAEMRNAAWLLEASGRTGESWGLTKLLEGNLQPKLLPYTYSRSRSRLVDVSTLFDR